MTTVNLSQQQSRDARRQFGRSMIVQLLIFMAIELGAEVLFYVMNLFLNFLVNDVGRDLLSGNSMVTLGQFSQIISFVFNVFSFIILVVLLFLHRSVTFRSADTVMHNVLPLAILLLFSRLISWIISTIVFRIPSVSRLAVSLIDSDSVIVFYFIFNGLALLFTAATSFAHAGIIHFARKKGSEIMLILPLMGFLLLSVLSPIVGPFSSYSYIGMVRRLYSSSLPSFLSSLVVFILNALLPYLITGLASFFAMRMLVYRDTYDTKPRVQQQYMQRYVQANPQLFQLNTPAVPEQTAYAGAPAPIAAPTPVAAPAPAPVQPVSEAAPAVPDLEARKEE